ncbi:MAG TPA: glycosyltransferase family 4 protein, partial [Chloroflexota bacterium]|nr:glycosyltransferase family 4 protein [Chloroflexota bacterium]
MESASIAFVLEQSLGHVTYTKNLQEAVADDPDVLPTWLPVEHGQPNALQRLPVIGDNWSFQASYQARLALQRAGAPSRFGSVFLHTQVTALMSAHVLRWGNGVVSLDATPRNYDSFGSAYNHQRSPEAVERVKDILNRRAFRAARHLVTWSAWARASLIQDYGVPAAKVTVIPPGTNLDLWQRPGDATAAGGKLRLLFVGGDFQRKGGDLLLDVFRRRLADRCELDLVTSAPLPPLPPGVRVHRNVAPNSAPLRTLFAEADVFVLPSRADCLAVVLMEATAARLPIVTTGVGALGEAVQDGQNGMVIAPDDGAALGDAILRLQAEPALRARMAQVSYRLAQERFDARKSAQRLLTLLKSLARKRVDRRPG